MSDTTGSPRHDDDAIDEAAIDEAARPTAAPDDERAVPAAGGTFGVTVDESGYAPVGAPRGYGPAPASAPHPAGFERQADGREFAAPQFGREAREPLGTPLGLVALVLAVLALVALLVPGWAWIVGGALGVVAVALGAGALRSSRRYALLALIGGGIAVVVAIATAIAVLMP